MKLFNLLIFAGVSLAQSPVLFSTGYSGSLQSWTLKDSDLVLNQNLTGGCGSGASWLTYEASSKRLFCSVDASPEGRLVVFDASNSSSLKINVNIPTIGGDVHADLYHTPSGKSFIAIAHYTGHVTTYERELNNKSTATQTYSFGGGDRKGVESHPEQILNIGNRFLLVPDVGLGMIHQFSIDQQTGRLSRCASFDLNPSDPNMTPRRLKFWMSPNQVPVLFAGMEKTSEIMKILVTNYNDTAAECLKFNRVKTMVSAFSQRGGPQTKSFIGEMRIKNNFLYVSNRGDETFEEDSGRIDSISMLKINETNGDTTWVKQYATGGSYPRTMVFNAKGDKLVIGNQISGTVQVDTVNINTGDLTELANGSAIPAWASGKRNGLSSVVWAD